MDCRCCLFGTLVAVLLTTISKNTLNTDVNGIFFLKSIISLCHSFVLYWTFQKGKKKWLQREARISQEKKGEDPQWGRLAFVFRWIVFLNTGIISYRTLFLIWHAYKKSKMRTVCTKLYTARPYKWKKNPYHCRCYGLIVWFFLFPECHYSKISLFMNKETYKTCKKLADNGFYK